MNRSSRDFQGVQGRDSNRSTQPLANGKIRAALDDLPPLPTAITDWLVETGTDSADEPAVWVYVSFTKASELEEGA